jgi:fluoride exporter
MILLAIAAGGALGSVARYLIGTWVQTWLQTPSGAAFPIGTLVVNVAGSFVLGLLYGLLQGTESADGARAFAGIGFCGGFTTFSTFSWDTVRMLQDGDVAQAGANVAASVSLSVLAAFVGIALAGALRR